MRADRATLAGIALVCFANLLLEITITRLFSATMFYHFTFLAVALALFGIAASGVWVFLNEERLAADLPNQLAKNARRFAIATVIALVYAMANPIDVIFISGTSRVPNFSNRQFWQLVLLVAVTAPPFFFAGAVVSLALTFFRENVNRVYFWDLAGAAVAALVAGVTLGLLGGTSVVILVAVLGLAGAALFDRRARGRWLYPAIAAVLLVVNLVKPIVTVPSVKGVKSEKTVFEKWNIFSRITVDDTATIKIDASAATHIENLKDLTPALYVPQVSALVYSTFDPPADQVLIIGPGGGRDVIHALSAGAQHVTGVEVNPIIAETIMKERFRERSGGLYLDPRVDVVVDDGRSFVRRAEVRYDVIQASLVDTWAATAAGAFALTENTLYTIEAFEDYFGHLSDRGALTMTRWHTGDGGESARLLILAGAALEARGVPPANVRAHVFYAVSPKDGLGTLVAARNPLPPDAIARLTDRAKKNGWNVPVVPGRPASNALERYLDAGAYSDLVTSAREELSPPTDDRPFFFYFKKLGDLVRPSGQMNDPGLWLMISIGSVLALSIVFILLPLAAHWMRRGVPKDGKRPRDQLAVLSYFGVVGFGFMTVEIGLLQRFTLFLGHPSYSLIVILFAVLLSTAAGAYLSGRVGVPRLGKLMMIGGAALAVIAILYGVVLGDLLRDWVGLGIVPRIALTILLVAPCGLVMGTMIPSAVRVLGAADSPLVPWGWGINGATSVMGTVAATIIAIYGGFTMTFVAGAIAYAAAGALGVVVARVYAAK
jgi:spermidine synthase